MQRGSSITLLLAVLLAPGAASAEPEGTTHPARPDNMQFEVGLWGGAFFADKEHEFYESARVEHEPLQKIAPDLGLRVGFNPHRFDGVEGEAGMVLGETLTTEESADLYALRGSIVAQFPARITPFVLGGVGRFFMRSDALGDDEDTDFHAGAGVKLFVTPRLQIRLDGRLYRSNRHTDGVTDNGDVNHYAATAGLAWAGDFVGKDALLAQKAAGIPRSLIGFVIDGKGIARHGYPVVDRERAGTEAQIGAVTSGTGGISVPGAIGMAYVPRALAAPGTEITIDCRGKDVPARVVKGPFYQRGQA
jgi:opacity protein-like surface antigen